MNPMDIIFNPGPDQPLVRDPPLDDFFHWSIPGVGYINVDRISWFRRYGRTPKQIYVYFTAHDIPFLDSEIFGDMKPHIIPFTHVGPNDYQFLTPGRSWSECFTQSFARQLWITIFGDDKTPMKAYYSYPEYGLKDLKRLLLIFQEALDVVDYEIKHDKIIWYTHCAPMSDHDQVYLAAEIIKGVILLNQRDNMRAFKEMYNVFHRNSDNIFDLPEVTPVPLRPQLVTAYAPGERPIAYVLEPRRAPPPVYEPQAPLSIHPNLPRREYDDHPPLPPPVHKLPQHVQEYFRRQKAAETEAQLQHELAMDSDWINYVLQQVNTRRRKKKKEKIIN